MSHEITKTDSLVLRDKKAWHGLGEIISDDLTAVEACEGYGLGWKVNPWPLFTKNPVTGEIVEVEDKVANVRMISTPEGDIPSVLGVVGDSYKVCQNIELAEFMDALAQTGEVVIETAGSIRGGKRVWFLARSGSYELAGGDKSYSYLLGSNAHDGTGAIRLTPTDVRVVCKNTLSMVVPDVEADGRRDVNPAAITVRHSGEISSKLHEAKKALRQYDSIVAKHRDLANELSNRRIDRNQALSFFAHRYAETFAVDTTTDNIKLQARRRKRMDEAAAAFLSRYDSECKKFGGESAWLALNAWTGYVQHEVSTRGDNPKERNDNRVRSTLFGSAAKRSLIATADAVSTFLSA